MYVNGVLQRGPNQKKVLRLVRSRLYKHDIYRICTDRLPEEEKIISAQEIERAIDSVFWDTIDWEVGMFNLTDRAPRKNPTVSLKSFVKSFRK